MFRAEKIEYNIAIKRNGEAILAEAASRSLLILVHLASVASGSFGFSFSV